MGIRKNFGFNIILTGANYIFPLLVFPYITRIFDAELIGTCNFVESIVNYLVMFSALGLSGYGVREVARRKGNQHELNRLFSSLLCINVCMSVLWLFVYLICVFTVPQLYELRSFCLIGCIKIITSCFLVEWFFQGMEQFKYITFRAIVIRLLFVVSVFIFVRTRADILVYFSLLMLTVGLNAAINMFYSRNFVKISFKNIQIKRYLVPLLSFGYYTIFVYFYTTFNSIYLGFATNETEVGYYSISAKIVAIALSVFTALNTVMIPQISKWLHDGNAEILNQRINQCIVMLILLATPISYYCLIYAGDIVSIIAGEGYEGAVIPLKIVSILILVLGLSQTVMAVLSSSVKANKPLIIISSFGAVTGISINILLTQNLQCIGSCISWTTTELLVLMLATYLMLKVTTVKLDFNKMLATLVSTVVYVPFMVGLTMLIDNSFLRVLFSGIVSALLMILILRYWLSKEWLRGVVPVKIERLLFKF